MGRLTLGFCTRRMRIIALELLRPTDCPCPLSLAGLPSATVDGSHPRRQLPQLSARLPRCWKALPAPRECPQPAHIPPWDNLRSLPHGSSEDPQQDRAPLLTVLPLRNILYIHSASLSASPRAHGASWEHLPQTLCSPVLASESALGDPPIG